MKLWDFLAATFQALAARKSVDVKTKASGTKVVAAAIRPAQLTLSQCHDTTNNEPHFRFLDLPLEIRILIYSFLVPTGIVTWYRPTGPDKQHISPQILRINRQIYTEALEELYGRAEYQVEIGIDNFCVHGCYYTLHNFPPYTFHYIHKIDVKLRLTAPRLYSPGKTILGLYGCTKWLEACFPRGREQGKEGKLRSLKLRLGLAEGFVGFYAGKPEELARDLMVGLKPLWDLGGLLNASVVTQSSPTTLGALRFAEYEMLNEVVDGVEQFGQRLVRRIGPPPAAVI